MSDIDDAPDTAAEAANELGLDPEPYRPFSPAYRDSPGPDELTHEEYLALCLHLSLETVTGRAANTE